MLSIHRIPTTEYSVRIWIIKNFLRNTIYNILQVFRWFFYSNYSVILIIQNSFIERSFWISIIFRLNFFLVIHFKSTRLLNIILNTKEARNALVFWQEAAEISRPEFMVFANGGKNIFGYLFDIHSRIHPYILTCFLRNIYK
jgi:hypothetical protein